MQAIQTALQNLFQFMIEHKLGILVKVIICVAVPVYFLFRFPDYLINVYDDVAEDLDEINIRTAQVNNLYK